MLSISITRSSTVSFPWKKGGTTYTEAWPELHCESKCPYLHLSLGSPPPQNWLLNFYTNFHRLSSDEIWTLLHRGVTHPWNPNAARTKVLMRVCSATLPTLISIIQPARLTHIIFLPSLHLSFYMYDEHEPQDIKRTNCRLTVKWFFDHTNWPPVSFLIAFNVSKIVSTRQQEVHFFVFSPSVWLKGGLYSM